MAGVRIFALWLGGTTVQSASEALKHIAAQPKPPQSFDGLLLSGGVKIFMDGSGGGRTAWMYQDWNRNSTGKYTGNSGYPNTNPDVYREMVRMIHASGVHVSTHAVGDRAIDWVVDTYAQVLQEKPANGLRHGIIHCNTPTDHAIESMARLQKEYDAALRSYAAWAARQLFLEDKVGSIEAGKDADIAVWVGISTQCRPMRFET
jgi:predicted amidohydrolase YtcJ